MADEVKKDEVKKVGRPKAPKVLVFKCAGYCPELKKNYPSGNYTPKDDKEFDALKKYAV